MGHYANECKGGIDHEGKFCSNCKRKGHAVSKCFKPGGKAFNGSKEKTNVCDVEEPDQEFSFFSKESKIQKR